MTEDKCDRCETKKIALNNQENNIEKVENIKLMGRTGDWIYFRNPGVYVQKYAGNSVKMLCII